MPVAAPAAFQANTRSVWQNRLRERCRAAKLGEPVFQIVSDRRGGRTAWSGAVEIAGKKYSARYWYDGNYLDNAREDAAEVALQALNQQGAPR